MAHSLKTQSAVARKARKKKLETAALIVTSHLAVAAHAASTVTKQRVMKAGTWLYSPFYSVQQSGEFFPPQLTYTTKSLTDKPRDLSLR